MEGGGMEVRGWREGVGREGGGWWEGGGGFKSVFDLHFTSSFIFSSFEKRVNG